MSHMVAQVLIRSTLFFIGSAIAIIGYEFLYHKKYEGSQVPISVGMLVLLALLAFRCSSFAIGAVLSVYLTGMANRFIMTFGGLLGLWISAIGMQFAQNGVRLLLDKPMMEVSYIRKDAFKIHRRSKSKSLKRK